jgi:hypothetical protein
MFLDNCTGVCAKWLGRHGVDVIPVALVRKRPSFFCFFSLTFLFLLSGLVCLSVNLNLGWFPLLFRDQSVDFLHYTVAIVKILSNTQLSAYLKFQIDLICSLVTLNVDPWLYLKIAKIKLNASR